MRFRHPAAAVVLVVSASFAGACGGATPAANDPVDVSTWCAALADAYCAGSAHVYEDDTHDLGNACPSQYVEICEATHREDGGRSPGSYSALSACARSMRTARDVAMLEAARERCP